MGLPLFVTPDEAEASSKTSEKVAARSRSAIRRQRTVRRPNYRERPLELLDSDVATDDEPRLSEIEDALSNGARFLTRLRRHASSRRPAFVDPHSSRDVLEVINDGIPRVQPSDTFRNPMPEGYEPPLMPPVPETVDFQIIDFQARNQQEESFLAESRADLIRLDETIANIRRIGRSGHALDNTSALSTNALSQRQSSLGPALSTEPRSSTDTSQRAARRQRMETGRPWASRGIDNSVTNGISPRSRSRRGTIAEFETRRLRHRLPRMDGLGDRDRSLSPEGDGAWDTILTTITPDPHPPSVGSSFASTTASAAASTSSNPRSSGTSLTTMDSVDDTNFETACDIVEDGTDFSDTDVDDDDDLYGLQDDAHTARDNFWRSYADVVAARAARVARHSGASDSDSLGGMQRIIRRLALRENIPDDWWAEAGLRRTFQPESST